MKLTLQQAADLMGKSCRQVRYLIKEGRLPATKVGHQWRIESEDLPRTPGQEAARERKQAQLVAAVEDALEIPRERRRRYSVKDLRAFQIASSVYQRATEHCGAEHPLCHALRECLDELARGCHRYRHADKANAYTLARDAASRAACELALMQGEETDAMLELIEQELMAALSGLLRRVERKMRHVGTV